jgi:hypothetical protein
VGALFCQAGRVGGEDALLEAAVREVAAGPQEGGAQGGRVRTVHLVFLDLYDSGVLDSGTRRLF